VGGLPKDSASVSAALLAKDSSNALSPTRKITFAESVLIHDLKSFLLHDGMERFFAT